MGHQNIDMVARQNEARDRRLRRRRERHRTHPLAQDTGENAGLTALENLVCQNGFALVDVAPGNGADNILDPRFLFFFALYLRPARLLAIAFLVIFNL